MDTEIFNVEVNYKSLDKKSVLFDKIEEFHKRKYITLFISFFVEYKDRRKSLLKSSSVCMRVKNVIKFNIEWTL